MSGPRTYDRETYHRFRDAWRTFGHEWTAVREACALAGYPFPPSGSELDEREDAEPSQRVIVWRAMDYRPLRTLNTIRISRSWSEVVRKIIADEDRLREDATYRDKDDAWEKDGRPTDLQAVRRLGDILTTIRESTA